eukprot:gene6641-9428_t
MSLEDIIKPWLERLRENSSTKNKHLLLVCDSCFSGRLVTAIRNQPDEVKTLLKERESSITVQAACGENELVVGGFFMPAWLMLNSVSTVFVEALSKDAAGMAAKDGVSSQEETRPHEGEEGGAEADVRFQKEAPNSNAGVGTKDGVYSLVQTPCVHTIGKLPDCHKFIFISWEKKLLINHVSQLLTPDEDLVASRPSRVALNVETIKDLKDVLKQYSKSSENPSEFKFNHKTCTVSIFDVHFGKCQKSYMLFVALSVSGKHLNCEGKYYLHVHIRGKPVIAEDKQKRGKKDNAGDNPKSSKGLSFWDSSAKGSNIDEVCGVHITELLDPPVIQSWILQKNHAKFKKGNEMSKGKKILSWVHCKNKDGISDLEKNPELSIIGSLEDNEHITSILVESEKPLILNHMLVHQDGLIENKFWKSEGKHLNNGGKASLDLDATEMNGIISHVRAWLQTSADKPERVLLWKDGGFIDHMMFKDWLKKLRPSENYPVNYEILNLAGSLKQQLRSLNLGIVSSNLGETTDRDEKLR